MKRILLVFAFAYIITSCNSAAGNKEIAATDSTVTADTSKAFLVTSYILSQIQDVDSTPIGVMLITEKDGKTDSAFVPKETFDKYARQFIEPDLNDTTLSKIYRQDNFYDATINKVVQNITTKKEDAIISSVQMYFNQENSRVTGLYMEKNFRSGDTSITQKMRWKHNRNFQIITLKYINGKEIILNQKLVWDYRD